MPRSPRGVSFTPEARQAVIDARAMGLPVVDCAKAGGINERTIYEWIAVAEDRASANPSKAKKKAALAFRRDWMAATERGRSYLVEKGRDYAAERELELRQRDEAAIDVMAKAATEPAVREKEIEEWRELRPVAGEVDAEGKPVMRKVRVTRERSVRQPDPNLAHTWLKIRRGAEWLEADRKAAAIEAERRAATAGADVEPDEATLDRLVAEYRSLPLNFRQRFLSTVLNDAPGAADDG